jgi:hypothetical protein
VPALLAAAILLAPVLVMRPWQTVSTERAGMLGVGLWSEPRHRAIETLDAARRLVGLSKPAAIAPVLEPTPAAAQTNIAAPVAEPAPVVEAAPVAETAPVADAPVTMHAPKYRSHATKKHGRAHGRHSESKPDVGAGGLDL